MNLELLDKTALVSGSTKGIGFAIASHLAKEGARVIVNGRSDDSLATAMERIGQAVPEAKLEGFAGDLSTAAAVQALVERFPSVDILVNNAGTRQDGPFILMGDEKWEEVMNVNLRGTVYATKAFVRGMMARKWGRIVNIVSPTGIIGKAGQTNYGASKGAVIALTRSLAREMAPFGVLVNAVNPGLIHTELTQDVSEELRREMLAPTILKREGEPREVAGVVAFLCSDWASYMSGQIVNVDGGLCP